MSLDIQAIRQSFDKAKPIADQVADKFYEHLWDDFPDAKPLFAETNMVTQKKALIASLVYIVDHLEDEEALVKYLKAMGLRHVKYGAAPEHYDWVGASLLKTLEHFLGDAWTEELKGEWTKAYGVIAQTMIAGASGQS